MPGSEDHQHELNMLVCV